MTGADFISEMKSIVALAETGLNTAAGFDAALELPAAAIEAVVPVVEGLVTAAVNAWSNASGTPINVTTLTALLPNATPLAPPTPPPAS